MSELFDPSFMRFFADLRENNEREWFHANKDRFEHDVREPMLRFIEAMGPRLRALSEHFVADPRKQGGSMFRIHRDVRFSKDKSPYKTHAACQFRHALGKDVHAPGFYMHANDRELSIGMGIWRPPSDALQAIRESIRDQPAKWRTVLEDAALQRDWQWGGQSLKRPPRGFDKDDPHIDDLKRKDFILFQTLSPETILREDLPEWALSLYQSGMPLMHFLGKALNTPI
jgi:uncharacterized protein (TIGR02453 family)